MTRIGLGTSMVLGFVAAACATTGGARPGVVALEAPQEVHGDETAIAWPFVVTNAGEREIVADFHLRIEDGGTLIGVRPDAENPDRDATVRWRGELRNGEGYWIGDVLPRGSSIRLWALVRPTPGRDPRIRVRHWPTDGRDNPLADPLCEIWTYDIRARRTSTQTC